MSKTLTSVRAKSNSIVRNGVNQTYQSSPKVTINLVTERPKKEKSFYKDNFGGNF